MDTQNKIKMLREKNGMNRKEFSTYIGIILRTIEDWEAGRRTPPEYIHIFIENILETSGRRSV